MYRPNIVCRCVRYYQRYSLKSHVQSEYFLRFPQVPSFTSITIVYCTTASSPSYPWTLLSIFIFFLCAGISVHTSCFQSCIVVPELVLEEPVIILCPFSSSSLISSQASSTGPRATVTVYQRKSKTGKKREQNSFFPYRETIIPT